MTGKTHCGRKDQFWLIVPEGSVCWIGKGMADIEVHNKTKQEAGSRHGVVRGWVLTFLPLPIVCLYSTCASSSWDGEVIPSWLILWKCPQRQVCSDILMILSQPPWPWRWPITWVTLEMEPQPLHRLGSLLTLNHATSSWTHSLTHNNQPF